MKTRNPKVLIVDDEPINLRLLKALIAPMGVETFTASNGSQTLEMIPKVSPDVILLDIGMPDMDGIEVCRRLKKDVTTRNIPVVFVTAFSDVENHAAAVEAGGIGFIIKPVEKILVHASIRNAIRLKHLSDEVDELMRQRAGLTHMIVHDINNLLTLPIGYARIMLSDKTLPPSFNPYVVAIEKSNGEIQEMTKSLLEVEKLESGNMEVLLAVVNLGRLAEQRANLWVSQAVERGIQMELPNLAAEVGVRADPNLLTRVVDNLIFNAIKFCPVQGSVKIDISVREGMGEIAVTNDGPPILKEFHERIFEKFAQVEVRQATGRKGVGLGLTFCKVALEAMEGMISVESPVPGREDGTRFVVRLPASQI
jgi:two-component system sensor histidine kinase/response regulator